MFDKRLLLLLALGSAEARAQRFYPDDPIREDRDRLPIARPGDIELSPTYDVLWSTFAAPELEDPVPRASNVNTLGEVPDSSWFTNRIGIRDMTPQEVARGPATVGPPQLDRPLTIVAAKKSGISPGFTVRDARGHIYFLKFDPREYPNLSTGADVVSKSFFHAIGYNVPEAYLVTLRADSLRIDPGAEVSLPKGRTAAMEPSDVEIILRDAARSPDGEVRAVASLRLPGEAIGPFQFHGSRPDDANDIFPHQHRRELRGYRVFCAWLNHDDSRAINTLDTYEGIGPEGGLVKHYLIDFGSTLGSGSDAERRIAPQSPRAGNEYLIDLAAARRAAASFGILDRPWRDIRYPFSAAEIGRIEAEAFDPDAWKPEYPNPAFDRMLPDDALWAAKIVARFTDDHIRATVAEGGYRSEAAERYLGDTLIRRRDKIVATYFRRLAPLDAFAVQAGGLVFRNLGEPWGIARARGYEITWLVFDNETTKTREIGEAAVFETPSLDLPESDADYLLARIRTLSDEPGWAQQVEVYLRRAPDGYEVVGVDREL